MGSHFNKIWRKENKNSTAVEGAQTPIYEL